MTHLGKVMTARLILLLAMFFGIAVTPVKPVLACAVKPIVESCAQCCDTPQHACCAVTTATPKPAPALPSPTADDGKQLAAPTLVFLCLSPLPATEAPAVQRQFATHLPVRPLVALNCIRLI
jgi:hypothetical protein